MPRPTPQRAASPVPDDEPASGVRAWVWIAAVAVAVVVALGLSVLAGTDARDPDLAPVDHTAFCGKVQRFSELSAEASDPTQDPGHVRRLAGAMGEVARAAPEPVQAAANDWATALGEAAGTVERLATKYGTGSLDAVEPAMQAIDNVGLAHDASVTRLANYAKKACGIDLGAPAPPVSSAPATEPGSVPGSAPTGSAVAAR